MRGEVEEKGEWEERKIELGEDLSFADSGYDPVHILWTVFCYCSSVVFCFRSY